MTRIVALLAALGLVLGTASAAVAGDIDFDPQAQDCYCTGAGGSRDGSIFGADWQRERVIKWNAAGVLQATFFRPEGADVPFHPESVAEAPGGDLVVPAREGAMVLSPQGRFLRRLETAPSRDVALDDLGFAYLTYDGAEIHKVPIAGGPVQVLTSPTWLSLSGIAYGARTGHLFVVDHNRSAVDELTTDGIVLRSFGGQGTGAGQLNSPTDLAVGPDGSIYVSESTWPTPAVKKFDGGGTEVGSYSGAGSVQPEGLAIAGGDHLVFARGTGMQSLDLVTPTPVLMPLNPTVYAGALVRFNATQSHLAFDTMRGFEWDYDGDGTVDEVSGPGVYPIPSHRYNEPGTYRMTVKAIASSGGSATLASTVTVTRAGVALSVSRSPVLTGVPATLDASRPALPETGVEDARWDLDGNGSFETDGGASPTLSTTFATPGTRTVHVRLTREGGAVDEGALDVAVKPKPPAGPVGVSINGGDKWTNDPDVTLDVVWPAGVGTITASNDGGFRQAKPAAAVAHLRWKLLETGRERQPKTVYLRFDDRTQTLQDDIILDQTDPTLQSASVTDPAAAGARSAARRAHRYRLRLRASDRTSGVGYVQLATRRSRPARARRYHRTLTVTSTTRPVFVRVRDRAGNYSRWRRLAVRRG